MKCPHCYQSSTAEQDNYVFWVGTTGGLLGIMFGAIGVFLGTLAGAALGYYLARNIKPVPVKSAKSAGIVVYNARTCQDLTKIIETSKDMVEIAVALRERALVYRINSDSWRLDETKKTFEQRIREEIEKK